MSVKLTQICFNYGPYHLARLRAVVNQCRKKNWDVFGIELARSEEEYPWQTNENQFPCEIISVINDHPLEKARISDLIWKLISILNQSMPDVVAISGYAHPAMFASLLWCLWHKKIAILLSETTEYDEPRSWWKEKIKYLLIIKFKAALVGGHPQKRYLIKLGMPSDAIFLGYDVVGNNIFHPSHIKSLPCPLDKPFFLAINRFVTKKNLPFLLSAYANYRQIVGTSAWDLVLCGDGELQLHIKELINQLQIQYSVHLPGFLQQDQLLPYFAHAKCFIHASIQEQWGLVVNEAMAAGLPVLVSNHCGCYEDLIIESVNGFGFNPENQQELTNLMIKVSLGKVDLELMGKASLKHIEKYSPDYFAEGLRSAIEFAMNKNS